MAKSSDPVDFDTLCVQVDDLRSRLVRAEREVQEFRGVRQKWLQILSSPEVAGAWLGILFAIALVLVVGFMVFKSVTASGMVEYCHIAEERPEHGLPYVKVTGHRSWRTDIDVAMVSTIVEAQAAAEKFHCQIK